ncbi:MAG: sensor histidine kinase [Anaerolineae bacterium]
MSFVLDEKEKEVRPPARRLSERVALLQQILPFLLLILVMAYEVTRHVLFPNVSTPLLFAIELLVFGFVGPAALWLTLNWIRSEMRAREEMAGELDLRTRMMMEMHHRIKNNLQTVADLLSLEMNRADGRSPAESLRDSVARIKSIAAAHEMFSPDQIGGTDVTELAKRVADSARFSQARPDQTIHIQVQGPQIMLPSKPATAFALVINELVSNALEHGLAGQAQGEIDITLEEDDQEVRVEVQDNGAGLRPDFELSRNAGLGLRIVRTLVEKDLHGALTLRNAEGACAEFTFPL